MNTKTIVAAAAVLLTATGVCLAQPPGITPEMIARSLPLEGAPLAEPGPYQVTSEAAFGSPGHHRVSPDDARRVSQKRYAARDGVGQRRVCDRQYALRGLPDDDRLARLPGVGHGPGGRCRAKTGKRRRCARRDRLGDKRKRTKRLAAERQDRTGQNRGDGPVVRRISLDCARAPILASRRSVCSIQGCRKKRRPVDGEWGNPARTR